MTHAIALLGGPARLAGWRAALQLRKLTNARTRRRVASGLLRVIAEAESPRQSIGASLPVQTRAVVACREEMLELALRLRSARPVHAHGVSLAARLVTDAGSPLYQADGDLRAAVGAALLALDGHLG